MAGEVKLLIQSVFNRFGLHLRRLDRGVSLEDPYAEQVRILGSDIGTIFEVGAADGRDCEMYCGLFPKAKVYAFEPFVESFQKIEERARVNPSIIPFNCAMADEAGEAEFHVSNWADASSLLKPRATGSTSDAYTASKRSIKVQVDTIDAVCKKANVNKIDLLKIDAQGAELRILQGAKEILSTKQVDLIFTEIHFLSSYENAARFDQLMGYLTDHGFRLHNLYGLARNQKGELLHGDAMFIHNRIPRS